MAPAGMVLVTRLFVEILEEIFLRLPTPEDLARAAAASPAFRAVITARPFLRRFRELHPPPLLGFVTAGGTFQPATDPHPSAPLGRALAAAADFSCAFVPKPADGGEFEFTPWSHRDGRDGRVLLMCTRRRRRSSSSSTTTTAVRHDPLSLANKVFAVCDPLSRRSVLLPPIPALGPAFQKEQGFVHEFGHKLVPAAAGDDEDDRDFRVICWAGYVSSFVIFVFLSAAGRWCVRMRDASPNWRSFLGLEKPNWEFLSNFSYLDGCFYWTSTSRDNVIGLDTSTMEFSTAAILFRRHVRLMNLPEERIGKSSIVVLTEDALEMLTLVEDYSQIGSFHLYHTTQQNSGGKLSVKLKTVIALPPGYSYFTVGETDGFLFLQGIQQDQCDEEWGAEDLFSLKVQTSELKKVYGGAPCLKATNPVHSYFGFPPSLSKPSLSSAPAKVERGLARVSEGN